MIIMNIIKVGEHIQPCMHACMYVYSSSKCLKCVANGLCGDGVGQCWVAAD